MTAPAGKQASSGVAVTAAYTAAALALRQRLLAVVLAYYGAQGYRSADAFVAAVVPVALAAQGTMSALTSAYLSSLMGTLATGVPAALVTGQALRSVDPTEVYRRPYVQVWTDLAQGKPFDQAVIAGRQRAESIAVTDLQLAKTKTAQQVLKVSPARVTGYRRELGPDPKHCALCVLTSSRVYFKGDLLPLHPGCYCTPVPVLRGEQVPEVDPAAVHDAIRSTLGDSYVNASGKGYRDLVVTHEHGELGPVLGVRDQAFTGPRGIPGG